MSTAIPLRKGTGLRRASSYKPIEISRVDLDRYPGNSELAIGALHDLGYFQGILSNAQNFSTDCTVDVSEVRNGILVERTLANEQDCRGYFDSISHLSPNDHVSFRAIFCYLERAEKTSFGCRLSLSRVRATQMLEQLKVSPQFLSSMAGEPDYLAPGDFCLCDQDAKVQHLAFFCQQPRWQIHTKDIPLSIHMSHDLAQSTTSYLIMIDRDHSRLPHIKRRIAACFATAGPADRPDPFMLHCMIIHEMFLEARMATTPLRGQLYDQLDLVDEYSTKPSHLREKGELERLTIQLHVISQDLDSTTASAEMLGMIVRRMQAAHDRYCTSLGRDGSSDATTKTSDTLRYFVESAESQKRWLLSYKSRKDIALNLVFNLVTQQEATTSTTIAREAKADGTAMKTIAALTMIFLPGTFLSSVFSMSMLDGAKWWLYVALAIPLTVTVVGSWWLWLTRPHVFGRRFRNAAGVGSPGRV